MERHRDDRNTDIVFDRFSADLCRGLVVLVNCSAAALPGSGLPAHGRQRCARFFNPVSFDGQRASAKRWQAPALAGAGAAHEFENRFDVSPGLGLFGVTLFLVAAGPLGRRHHGLVAIGLKHLPRIIVNFEFAHPHEFLANLNAGRH